MSKHLLTQPEHPLVNFHGLVTVSPQMKTFFDRLKRVARTPTTVLLRGESGTGKELAARALHAHSTRRNKAFQAVNCATLTADLLTSELFGHVRGAFTGAVRARQGLFQLADGGTVFLDEIAEMPLALQARLLRVLQERSFIPLGGSTPIHVNVRLVSATHQALRRLVDQRQFREDLMYRIRVVVLFIPRLAERDGDIEALTWHFVREFNAQGYRKVTGITAEAMEALQAHPWPGNVRELRNNIEQAFAVGEGPVIRLDELTPELLGQGPTPPASEITEKDLERERLLDALRATGGRKGEAARRLGLSRTTLWRKLKTHGISP